MRHLLRPCHTLLGKTPLPRPPPNPALTLPTHRLASDTSNPPTFPGYAEDPLSAPLPVLTPGTRPRNATASPTTAIPKTEQEQKIAQARVVFGSRLAGPGERRAQILHASVDVNGVLVPPRPEEPDNCCMSGCVNCVWDQYRDELEEWAEASKKARMRARQGGEAGIAGDVVASGDDDGGGSETNWEAAGGEKSFGMDGGTDLFAGVPVGIREFMKTEKKLKKKKEGAVAG